MPAKKLLSAAAQYLQENSTYDKTSGCIVWAASLTGSGYATIQISGQPYQAHRLAYELVYGPIPAGFECDHKCRNRACINPAHLEAVTPRENVLRGIGPTAINARKTHCPKGHPYAGANLYVLRGSRYCKACHNLDTQMRYRAASAEKKALRQEKRHFRFVSQTAEQRAHVNALRRANYARKKLAEGDK